MEIGQVLAGKYRIDSFVSEGGMGAIYKATHLMLGKTVAIKLIKPSLAATPEIVSRFEREARSATTLAHPNIVAVFDLGQTPDGTLYIAMEFVDGVSLKSVLTSGGAMPASRAIAIERQVASALSAAHRNAIVHRDLKPQNVMLTRGDGGRETVKLVDFGVAKSLDEVAPLTTVDTPIGTPHYMAPEQASSKPVDPRSDIYSAGVILYEMLSGEVPFNDVSLAGILVKHLQELPQPPSAKNAAIPTALENIVLKCLEKDPARRYQTADELDAALAACEGGAADTPTVRMLRPAAVAQPIGAAETQPTVKAQSVPRTAQEPTRSSRAPLVAAIALLAIAIGAAAAMAINRSSHSDAPAPASAPASSAAVEPPSASPAMATARRVDARPNADASSSAPAPRSSPPSAPANATPTAQQASIASPAPAGTRTGAAAVTAAATPFPATPAVTFQCSGAPEICSPLRTQMDAALEKAGMVSVRDPSRADIAVAVIASVLQEQASRQFGTTFNVRNYSIDVSGEATNTSEAVSMPVTSTLSFDPQVGSQRAVERARTLSSDIIESIRAYAAKRR